MVFCNDFIRAMVFYGASVTILILIDGFLQYVCSKKEQVRYVVTILILIDGFLQLDDEYGIYEPLEQSQSLF